MPNWNGPRQLPERRPKKEAPNRPSKRNRPGNRNTASDDGKLLSVLGEFARRGRWFYAQRTLTKRSILPEDCANATVWLTSDQSSKTTGHVIPVDGGLTEAFLR
ncbi:MAG: hypothetical protein DMG50_17140 [Acidobacteria bacterium]|nr:MAG: hypothetical protein DMG50_17140 [Acidobacteriota bacterium]